MMPPSSSKGSLEALFRHHLLESEAAAVPPLPHVWEQLDNSLLLTQNAHYRRRLRVYRWAMAASLLLAAMAGGGWWRSQLGQSSELAATSTAKPGSQAAYATAPKWAAGTLARPGLLGATFSLKNSSIENIATLSLGLHSASLGYDAAPEGYQNSFGTSLATGGRYHYQAALANGPAAGHRERGSYPAADAASLAYQPHSAAPAEEAAAELTSAASVAYTPLTADQLAARLASLQLPSTAALPTHLATTESALPTAAKYTRPWQLQVAYTAGVFDPNIDFKKSPAEYDGSLGPGTVATTRDAAAEYRHHLRPGLSQRLSVWATRRLGIGRWSLRTGLELAQNSASSSSSVAFVGEQVPTLNSFVQVQANKLQTTTYCYRSLGLPVEAVYTSPLRRGFSLYGHAGAALTALFNVRSEVAGSPEATRIYSYESASSPYRQLLTTVRGGVGMRYQPSHHQWTLNLGPVAEAGILSLNTDPTQDFWNQQRPFSIGLEAGVEFSSLLKLVPAP